MPTKATSTSPIPFTSPSTKNGTMEADVGWLRVVYGLTVLYPERKIAEDSLRKGAVLGVYNCKAYARKPEENPGFRWQCIHPADGYTIPFAVWNLDVVTGGECDCSPVAYEFMYLRKTSSNNYIAAKTRINVGVTCNPGSNVNVINKCREQYGYF